jgi:hypothetical protein
LSARDADDYLILPLSSPGGDRIEATLDLESPPDNDDSLDEDNGDQLASIVTPPSDSLRDSGAVVARHLAAAHDPGQAKYQ